MSTELVLVTGGSGFVGAHCIAALLDDGYDVRTTVRNLAREDEVRQMVARAGADAGDRLSFAAADLTSDAGWDGAVAGCTFVLHVASPFPASAPRHEDELIVPARDGALRVLHAARAAGVRRVVLTSSFAAVGYGHASPPARPFTEEDWSDPDGPHISAYAKSKTLAELAAWDFVAGGGGPELAVVNPVAILGPLLGTGASTSIQLVQRLLDGDMPGMPRLGYGIVDVRDVVDLHLRAMTDPDAAGERFLAIAGEFASMGDIASVLRTNLPAEQTHRIPQRTLPNWTVRLAARFDGGLRQLTPELGRRKAASNAKARERLGWSPRSNEEAILATAASLRELRLLKHA